MPRGLPPQSANSKRDQIWEQKRLAKLGGQMIVSPAGDNPNIGLPVKSMRPPSHEELRRSMKAEMFNEARNLDQNPHFEQRQPGNFASGPSGIGLSGYDPSIIHNRLQSAHEEVAKSQVLHQDVGMPALGGLPMSSG